MASTIRQRLRRFNGTDYDTIHLETETEAVNGIESYFNRYTGSNQIYRDIQLWKNDFGANPGGNGFIDSNHDEYNRYTNIGIHLGNMYKTMQIESSASTPLYYESLDDGATWKRSEIIKKDPAYTNIDANTLLENGVYEIYTPNTTTDYHLPYGMADQHFFVEVYKHLDNYIRQVAYDVRSLNAYTRARIAGTWCSWQRIVTSIPDYLLNPHDGSSVGLNIMGNGTSYMTLEHWTNVSVTGVAIESYRTDSGRRAKLELNNWVDKTRNPTVAIIWNDNNYSGTWLSDPIITKDTFAQYADTTPTAGSTRPVTSGGVYAVLQNVGNAKIVTGSYVGDGNVTRTLTLPIVPKIIFIGGYVIVTSNGGHYIGPNGSTAYCRNINVVGTWDTTTVSWESEHPNYTPNASNQTYNYIAIG